MWPKALTTSTEVKAQFELNWNVDKDTKRDSSTENVNTLHWSSEERTFSSDKQVIHVKSEMNKQYTDSINYETCGTDKKKTYVQVFHLI